MQELIQQIAAKAGITEEQALIAANTTKDFIKGKVPPPVAGMVDQFFSGNFDPTAAMKSATSQQADWMDKAKQTAKETGDKLSDMADDATEKISGFAHDAVDKSSAMAKEAASHINEWASKAGGWSDDAMSKFKSFFNHDNDDKRKA
ncbi:MAG: hypothetical protein ABI378_00880 [Chitinophagaceae bacterium]